MASVGQESTSKTREKKAALLAPSQTTQLKLKKQTVELEEVEKMDKMLNLSKKF